MSSRILSFSRARFLSYSLPISELQESTPDVEHFRINEARRSSRSGKGSHVLCYKLDLSLALQERVESKADEKQSPQREKEDWRKLENRVFAFGVLLHELSTCESAEAKKYPPR